MCVCVMDVCVMNVCGGYDVYVVVCVCGCVHVWVWVNVCVWILRCVGRGCVRESIWWVCVGGGCVSVHVEWEVECGEGREHSDTSN